MQMSRDKRILESRLVLSLITSDSKVANYWLKSSLHHTFLCRAEGEGAPYFQALSRRNERGTNVFLMPNSTCMVRQ